MLTVAMNYVAVTTNMFQNGATFSVEMSPAAFNYHCLTFLRTLPSQKKHVRAV